MTVFNTLYADQYDLLYNEKSYDAECDLIEEAFRRFGADTTGTLLDVGCGTGKHSIEMSERGHNVTGIDISEAMLARARTNAAILSETRRPQFIHGDATSFHCGNVFDRAIMMFAVVGYMTSNEDVLAALTNVRRHLKPGSIFVCDFWYGPSVLALKPTDRVRVLDLPNEQIVRATNTILDPLSHTAKVTFRLWKIKGNQNTEKSQEVHNLRYFFPQEMRMMLGMSGFEMNSISAFPSLDEAPSDATWNALVVATAC
ncbi:MAG: class I SAM-dependent methyltransferase [Sphingorhabdus sp.]